LSSVTSQRNPTKSGRVWSDSILGSTSRSSERRHRRARKASTAAFPMPEAAAGDERHFARKSLRLPPFLQFRLLEVPVFDVENVFRRPALGSRLALRRAESRRWCGRRSPPAITVSFAVRPAVAKPKAGIKHHPWGRVRAWSWAPSLSAHAPRNSGRYSATYRSNVGAEHGRAAWCGSRDRVSPAPAWEMRAISGCWANPSVRSPIAVFRISGAPAVSE